MRLARLLLPATVALALSMPGALAQEAQEAQDVLDVESGRSYEGKVLSNDGTSVEIELTGGATMKVPYATLTPRTQYRLQLKETGDDAKSQLALAEWCVGKTLYDEAKTHFRRALAADALMEEEINARVVVARKTAANELLERAKRLRAENQEQEARHVLGMLVQELPLEEATREAAQMLAEETKVRKQESLSRPRTRGANEAPAGGADAPRRADGEPFSEATRTRFAALVESYQKLLDATHDGLVKGDSAGIDAFEKALKEGEKIRKAADALRPEAAGDAETAEALQLVDSKLEEAVVDARIHLVDNYLLRTSYKQAAEVVKLGLAEYPKNERLRRAMDRVTTASAINGGGSWGFSR
jgi:hypothetical protein